MKKKAFTLIEMLIVVIIIGILITMLLPKLLNAKGMTEDVKRKTFVNKITTILVSAQTQGKEIITENGKGGCFKDYLPKIISEGLASNLTVIKDTPGNITYGTKINGCDGDFGIAKTKDGIYIVVTHLINPKEGNFILSNENYKTVPYFTNNNFFGEGGINTKTCSSVKKGNVNSQCDLINGKTEGIYKNPDLKVYINSSSF